MPKRNLSIKKRPISSIRSITIPYEIGYVNLFFRISQIFYIDMASDAKGVERQQSAIPFLTFS